MRERKRTDWEENKKPKSKPSWKGLRKMIKGKKFFYRAKVSLVMHVVELYLMACMSLLPAMLEQIIS